MTSDAPHGADKEPHMNTYTVRPIGASFAVVRDGEIVASFGEEHLAHFLVTLLGPQ